MTSSELLSTIRKANQTHVLDHIRVRTADQELVGSGLLDPTAERFTVRVTLDSGQSIPPTPGGILTRSQFWHVRAKLRAGLEFAFDGLPHSTTLEAFPRTTWVFSVTLLDFVAGNEEPIRVLRRRIQAEESGAPVQELEGGVSSAIHSLPPKIGFIAILPKFKPIYCDSSTTFTEDNPFLGESLRTKTDTCIGQVPGWKYGLIKRDEDLEVHFCSSASYEAEGEQMEVACFHAFLQALAFTHGQHAWPIWFQHRRDDILVRDYLHLGTVARRCSHAPFGEHLFAYSVANKVSWSLQASLKTAYEFFVTGSNLAKEVTHLAYLAREATTGDVAQPIALLTLCCLLESLVQAAYANKVASRTVSQLSEFEKLRESVCKELDARAVAEGSANYQRLAGILRRAAIGSTRDKFHAVLQDLSLGTTTYWTNLYKTWSECRNPLSHRISVVDESEKALRQTATATSRIAGAINCIVLRLMDYRGFARVSAYEDLFEQIG